MKKLFLYILVFSIIAVSGNHAIGTVPNRDNEEAYINNYISNTYNHINFRGVNRLPYDVFQKAYYGYLNLRKAGMLNGTKNIISICDFDLPSTTSRLWVIDLDKEKVLYNTLVAHGEGSGEDCATSFSNAQDSHQSSIGFYVTADVYKGEHGNSLRLIGMDADYNDAAFDRGIVVHGAYYVSDRFAAGNDRLGRSWGCPALPVKLAQPIINTIKDSTCLFIYYPDNNYLEHSVWLNKKVNMQTEANFLEGIVLPENHR